MSLARSLVSICLAAVGAVAGTAEDQWAHHRTGATVPENARLTLVLDKDWYFLGENVLLHYIVQNTGGAPFHVDMGGDYRGASRHLRFKVTAVDEKGKPVADPDPSGFFMGGISYQPEVRPDKKHVQSLALLRYCKFAEPGVYTVRVRHDLGWTETAERKVPVGEIRLRLRLPTPEQARAVVEEMARAPKDPNRTAGEQTRPYKDFSVLRHPVYLPILAERARESDKDAVVGIGSIETPEATKALIDLLGHKNRAFVLHVAGILNHRLPDPEFMGKLGPRSPFRGPHYERRRELVKTTWRPEFAEPVMAHARELLSWRGKESMAYAAFMFQCLAGKDDLPHLVEALDHAVRQTEHLARETRVYPPPRGACRELLRATRMLLQRDAEAPAAPASPGQAAVFLMALTVRKDFRPEGWENRCGALLKHQIAYLRELTLKHTPRPLPKAAVEQLPALLGDPDIDVRIAACRATKGLREPGLLLPVLKILDSAREQWEIRSAYNAACRLGARLDALKALAARLDEPAAALICLPKLIDFAVESSGSQGVRKIEPDVARRLKAAWLRLLTEHAAALTANKRFAVGGPELTPDLLPPGYKLYKANKPWPPD